MKQDSGSYAVFSEQGSAASQITAAKVLGVIDYLNALGKQATQYPLIIWSKWKTLQHCYKFRKSVCPGMDTSSTVQVTKDLAEYSRASGSSGKELVLAPPYMCAVGQTVRKGSTTKRMGESTTLECLFVHRMQGLFFICILG